VQGGHRIYFRDGVGLAFLYSSHLLCRCTCAQYSLPCFSLTTFASWHACLGMRKDHKRV
jgi:hypothetical protein